MSLIFYHPLIYQAFCFSLFFPLSLFFLTLWFALLLMRRFHECHFIPFITQFLSRETSSNYLYHSSLFPRSIFAHLWECFLHLLMWPKAAVQPQGWVIDSEISCTIYLECYQLFDITTKKPQGYFRRSCYLFVWRKCKETFPLLRASWTANTSLGRLQDMMIIKNLMSRDWNFSSMGRVFVLHVTYLGSILGIPYGPMNLPGVISLHRARNHPKDPHMWSKNFKLN